MLDYSFCKNVPQTTSTWDKCQQAAITRTTTAIAIVVVTVAVMATATSTPKNNDNRETAEMAPPTEQKI